MAKAQKTMAVWTSKKTQASFGKCPCTVHVLRCIASTFGGWLKQLLQRRFRGARTAGCCVGGVVHLPVGGATAWCFYFGPLDWSFWSTKLFTLRDFFSLIIHIPFYGTFTFFWECLSIVYNMVIYGWFIYIYIYVHTHTHYGIYIYTHTHIYIYR